MKVIFSLTLFLFFSNANADCSSAFKYISSYNISAEGYWMQSAGSRYITYTSSGGAKSYLYDLEKRLPFAMTDEVDGFGLPEGDLYIHPNPIRFYSIKGAIEKGASNKPLFIDNDHTGFYQSIGELQSSENVRTIRVLTAEGRGKIQDYKITKNNSLYEFQKNFEKPVSICNNIDPNRNILDWETPIISRKGDKLAVKDKDTQTTKIYKIEMPNANCELIHDLNVITDKGSFNFEDSLFSYSTEDANAEGKYIKHVHILNLETKKDRIISIDSEDVLYHGFRPDGTFMYTKRNNKSETGSILSIINLPSEIHDRTISEIAKNIGQAWTEKCSLKYQENSYEIISQRLNKIDCLEVVKSMKVESKDSYINFCNSSEGNFTKIKSSIN